MAGGDNHDNLPVSCLTWGFPYDCPAKMPGEGALNATPFTHPGKGATLQSDDASGGRSLRVPLEHDPAERRVHATATQRARHAAPDSLGDDP